MPDRGCLQPSFCVIFCIGSLHERRIARQRAGRPEMMVSVDRALHVEAVLMMACAGGAQSRQKANGAGGDPRRLR
jgi:hypothetical protein